MSKHNYPKPAFRAPSTKRLVGAFDIDTDTAVKIRQVIQGKIDPCDLFEEAKRYLTPISRMMYAIDKLIDAFGVEHIAQEGYFKDSYWDNTRALYVNIGDTYVPTILFDLETMSFSLTTYGDFVERHPG